MQLRKCTQHTKNERLVCSTDRAETDRQTDGQTDATDCFAFPANAVGNYLTQ